MHDSVGAPTEEAPFLGASDAGPHRTALLQESDALCTDLRRLLTAVDSYGRGGITERGVRFGIEVAQMTGTYEGIGDAWLAADRLSIPPGPWCFVDWRTSCTGRTPTV